MEKQITKIYKVTSSKETLLMLDRLLSWLHWNGRWGHSGKVAMPFDGDGGNVFTVEGADVDKHRRYVNNLGNKGSYPEVVYADEYSE